MGKIASAIHAPFITSAAPSLFQMESWQELSNPRDVAKIFQTPEYAGWRSLRESDESRYIGVALPRFLARRPYGAKSDPVEEFDFEEVTGGSDASKYTWANSAYGMAVNINRSFKLYGWCSRIRGIESGGAIEGLPTHTFPTDDGGVDILVRPTSASAIGARPSWPRPASCRSFTRKTPTSRPSSGPSRCTSGPVRRPGRHRQRQPRRAPPLHVRDVPFRALSEVHRARQDCSFRERDQMQSWLQSWIMNYVDGDPAHSSEEPKRKGRFRRPRSCWSPSRAIRVLQLQVLPPAALPARGPHRFVATRVEAAVRQGGLARAPCTQVRAVARDPGHRAANEEAC